MARPMFVLLTAATLTQLSLSAGSIVINVSDPVQSSGQAVPGSQYIDTLSCVQTESARNCSTGNPSQSAVSPFGSAYATALSNGSGSYTLTAGGEIQTGQVLLGNYVWLQAESTLTLTPPQPVTQYFLFPSVQFLYSPGPAIAGASAGAGFELWQELPPSPQTGYFGLLSLSFYLYGQSDASFTLDPVTGTMILSVAPGTSGVLDILLEEVDMDHLTALVYSHVLTYRFDTAVTESSNSLGLALPGAGEPPSFSVQVGPLMGDWPAPLTGATETHLRIGATYGRLVPETNNATLLLIGLAFVAGTGMLGRCPKARRL